MLQSMGLQRVRHDLVTEQQQIKKKEKTQMLRKGYFSVKASHGALCGGVPQGSLSQSYSNTLQILPFSTLGLRMPLR